MWTKTFIRNCDTGNLNIRLERIWFLSVIGVLRNHETWHTPVSCFPAAGSHWAFLRHKTVRQAVSEQPCSGAGTSTATSACSRKLSPAGGRDKGFGKMPCRLAEIGCLHAGRPCATSVLPRVPSTEQRRRAPTRQQASVQNVSIYACVLEQQPCAALRTQPVRLAIPSAGILKPASTLILSAIAWFSSKKAAVALLFKPP